MGRQPTGQSSDRHPPSPTSAEQIVLRGPSSLPDPQFHAYRRDLADRALAGQLISPHYADPVTLTLVVATPLMSAAGGQSEKLAQLNSGDQFRMLDNKLGWAWGYSSDDNRVGYVQAHALGLD